MKRLASIAARCFIVFAAEPCLAQQPTNSLEPPYGYHHMWGGGPWGWHAGMVFGPIVMLLTIVGVAALIVLLMRGTGYGYRHGDWPSYGRWHGRGALDILEERSAKGEIDKNEFEEKRTLLRR